MSDIDPSSSQPRILIVDSSAILKSCFEGYPNPRSSSYKGKVLETQALYGYMHRVMRMYEKFEFEYMVHVMDPPGGSFYRYEMYPEYKDGRKEDDPTLAAQKALLKRTLEAFGERVILKRGVEADDIIATLADVCGRAGFQTMIISPDKDLMQMVSEEKQTYLARYVKDPATGYNDYAIYGEAEVEAMFGVRADQVADFLAIVGDSADNIPGVHKAGPKTAVSWLNEYGDLNSIMTNADKIKGKIGENLRAALPNLIRDQKLTNVLRDVPGVAIPPRPPVDEEKAAFIRDVIQWPTDFPARFACAGVPDPDAEPAPPASHINPQHTTVVVDSLEVTVQDTIALAPEQAPSQVVGEWLGNDPFDADPFDGVESQVVVTQEITVTETVTVEVVESAPAPEPEAAPPSRFARPGRIR